jgi:hypothetical protein
MKVKPMLGDYAVPGIQRIGTVEARELVEVPVPGLEGSYHQDLGSGAIGIVIEGTLAGDDARDDFLGKLRPLLAAGDPVDFVADILTATSIEQVLLADLTVAEVAGTVHTFRYSLVLAQHVEPPPSGSGADLGFDDLSDLNDQLASEAGALAGAMQVPDLLGSIPELKDPTPPLSGVTDGVKGALDQLSGVSGAITDLFGGG